MIFVFKTSVSTQKQAKQLKPHIDQLLVNGKWNFDLKDRDKVLRIDSEENLVLQVKALLNSHDIFCEELD